MIHFAKKLNLNFLKSVENFSQNSVIFKLSEGLKGELENVMLPVWWKPLMDEGCYPLKSEYRKKVEEN